MVEWPGAGASVEHGEHRHGVIQCRGSLKHGARRGAKDCWKRELGKSSIARVWLCEEVNGW